ncbi:MAG TPA: glycosyltransferase family 39 protein, partial [Bacteroidota bacterium]|nr:glycosyltransferase family 39 protein [Bacteroidota bacterium]
MEEQLSSMNSVISPRRWNSKTIFFLFAATAIVYIPSLFNHFTNWDDEIYILNNPLIKNLSVDGVAKIFSTPQYMGNYHPLTLLSYAFDYHLAELQPFVYHVTNLLLHFGCTFLVFFFLIELGMQQTSSFLAALLFGIHPMHVESVAWLSARKDVLYAFFFLGALICYVRYIQRDTKRWYILSLLLFICSIFSKAVAVSLPVVVLLIDYLLDRPFSKKSILEKIPFFLFS